MKISAGLLFVSLVSALPSKIVKRDSKLGSYSTSIASVQTESPVASTSDVLNEVKDTLWNEFWSNTSNTWVNTCGQNDTPDLWSVAVAGRAIALTKDISKTKKSVQVFDSHKSTTVPGGYSASTAKDSDIYTDDDAQVIWALLDAYNLYGDQSDLDTATTILEFIENQKDNDTGVIIWSYHGEYIASISLVEAALAALKLYEVKQNNDTLIEFAKTSLQWTFDNLLDPDDHFIYDGEGTDGSLNKGKLTYTIGVAMSALVYLQKYDQSQDWMSMAIELGVRALGAGNLNSQFFTNKYINDTPDHAHLFYAGLADVVEKTQPIGDYQKEAYALFKNELVRETRHLYDEYRQELNQCSSKDGLNVLLTFASLTQIFFQVNRVADRI